MLVAGSTESRPGVSKGACPTSSKSELKRRTFPPPISDTYQCSPSGSAAVWCGRLFMSKSSAVTSTVWMTSPDAASITDTLADDWFATYTRSPGAAAGSAHDHAARPATATATPVTNRRARSLRGRSQPLRTRPRPPSPTDRFVKKTLPNVMLTILFRRGADPNLRGLTPRAGLEAY